MRPFVARLSGQTVLVLDFVVERYETHAVVVWEGGVMDTVSLDELVVAYPAGDWPIGFKFSRADAVPA